jgi:hypothetical protein
VELSRPGREGRDLGMIVRRTVHSEELEDGGEEERCEHHAAIAGSSCAGKVLERLQAGCPRWSLILGALPAAGGAGGGHGGAAG